MNEDFHVKEIYDHIKDYIQPSASIVVFSLFLHPLAELHELWSKQKEVVNVKLEELWMREY